MPITLTGELAVLADICAVEEAEPLLDWLRRTASPSVDLSECGHVHTAVLQALLASRPVIVKPSPDPLLNRLLGAADAAADEAGKD